MVCLNCARKIVSPKSKTTYGSLTSYLKFRAAFTNFVKLSFAQIDGIIGKNLPMNAYRDEKWWDNSPNSARARAWLDAGWRTSELNLKEGYVIFQKVKDSQTGSLRRKNAGTQPKKPFTPAPHRIPKSKKTSKTKITKLYARLKNLERKRASMPKYRGSFKPKPAYEKKVFKPEEKPQ
jgi:hypothetical protein